MKKTSFINIQLFGEDSAESTPPPQDPVDTAIADTLLEYQRLYEEEKKAKEEAQGKVVELSKVIRTMGLSSNKNEEEKPKTLEDDIRKLFGE